MGKDMRLQTDYKISASNGVTHHSHTKGPEIPLKQFLQRTGQNTLPQSAIIQKTLKYLEQNDVIEAYLRGSFSFENADEHSDIDLFTVVEPDKLEATYESVLDFLDDNYPVILSCWDSRVKDYGGVGFMFICEDERGAPFQLDLYFALKGVTPKETLKNSPRVYSSDENYCWLEEINNLGREMPPDTQNFIDRFTKEQDKNIKAGLHLDDFLVNIFILGKHVQRGQNARVMQDKHALFSTAIDLFKLSEAIDTPHDAFYLADQLIEDYKPHSDPALSRAATHIKNMIELTNVHDQIETYFDYFENLLAAKFPDIYANNAKKLSSMKTMVEKKVALAPGQDQDNFKANGYTTFNGTSLNPKIS